MNKKEHGKRGHSLLHGQESGSPIDPDTQGEGSHLPPAAEEFEDWESDQHRKSYLAPKAHCGIEVMA